MSSLSIPEFSDDFVDALAIVLFSVLDYWGVGFWAESFSRMVAKLLSFWSFCDKNFISPLLGLKTSTYSVFGLT